MAHITDVLKKPVFTEKSMTLQAEENKYTFDVYCRRFGVILLILIIGCSVCKVKFAWSL